MTKHKNVALDELRILAALMVLGVHTGQKVGLGDAAAVGAQGVQLFFVLSGYLAAASLSRHPEPLPYYQRRIRLIPPATTIPSASTLCSTYLLSGFCTVTMGS